MDVNGITTFVYSRIKQNTTNTHYQTTDNVQHCRFLTTVVKVEKDRKFHNGKGFDEWFRIYGTSWDTGEKTGLIFTETPNYYYGDFKVNGRKTLLTFRFSEDRQTLEIKVYPFGHYHKIR